MSQPLSAHGTRSTFKTTVRPHLLLTGSSTQSPVRSPHPGHCHPQPHTPGESPALGLTAGGHSWHQGSAMTRLYGPAGLGPGACHPFRLQADHACTPPSPKEGKKEWEGVGRDERTPHRKGMWGSTEERGAQAPGLQSLEMSLSPEEGEGAAEVTGQHERGPDGWGLGEGQHGRRQRAPQAVIRLLLRPPQRCGLSSHRCSHGRGQRLRDRARLGICNDCRSTGARCTCRPRPGRFLSATRVPSEAGRPPCWQTHPSPGLSLVAARTAGWGFPALPFLRSQNWPLSLRLTAAPPRGDNSGARLSRARLAPVPGWPHQHRLRGGEHTSQGLCPAWESAFNLLPTDYSLASLRNARTQVLRPYHGLSYQPNRCRYSPAKGRSSAGAGTWQGGGWTQISALGNLGLMTRPLLPASPGTGLTTPVF